MPLALQRRTQGYFPCRASLADSAVVLTSTVSNSIALVVNAAPTSTWVAPLDGTPIILSATASDSDGSISQVDFYNGTTLIGTVLSGSAGDRGSGYTTTWSNVAPGTYQLTAKATDNNGARVTTTAVTVTVNATAATVYYIHPDHLGTPRAITTSDTANTKVWEWKNEDAFGNNAPNEDPSNTGINFKYNLRFPGQYFDQETGIHYNYFRHYDPSLGRYVQSDPIGLGGGINTFGYVGGDPLAFVDPYGLEGEMRWRSPSFFTLTTFEAERRDTTLEEAVRRGELTRNITIPAVTVALSPNAIATLAASTPAACEVAPIAMSATLNACKNPILAAALGITVCGNLSGTTTSTARSFVRHRETRQEIVEATSRAMRRNIGAIPK